MWTCGAGKDSEIGIRIKTEGGLRGFLSKTLRTLRMRWQGQGINRDGDRLTGIEEGFTLTLMKAFYGQKVSGF